MPPPAGLSSVPTAKVVGREQLRTGPGPSNVTPRVMEAMTLPILGELDPEFLQVTPYTTRKQT